MSSRVVRVYDGEFPSIDEIRFGDSANRAPWPKEVWAMQMHQHEVALFCVNFKSETPVREETGRPGPKSDETCRIFANLQDAETHACSIVKAYPSTVCLLRAKDETVLKRISNRAFLSRFAVASLLGLALWLIVAATIGLSVIWIIGALTHNSGFQWILALSAWQWFGLLAAGALLGIVLFIFKFKFSAQRKAARFVRAIETGLSPAEKARFRELDTLTTSLDPEDRKKARFLAEEYSQRIGQIRGQMK